MKVILLFYFFCILLIPPSLVAEEISPAIYKYEITDSETYSYDLNCNEEFGCYNSIIIDDNKGKDTLIYFYNYSSVTGEEQPFYYRIKIGGKLIYTDISYFDLNGLLVAKENFAADKLVRKQDYNYDVYKRVELINSKFLGLDNMCDEFYETTYYKYDNWNLDQIKYMQIQDANGLATHNTYTNTYDVFGRVAERSYNLKGKYYSQFFQYDGIDREIVNIDFNMNKSLSKYDDQGNLVDIFFTSAIEPYAQSINYQYDSFGHVINSSNLNKTDNLSEQVIYDDFGRVSGITSSIQLKEQKSNDYQKTMSYKYNKYNNIAEIIDYNGFIKSIKYGKDGRIAHLDLNLNGRIGQIDYIYYPYEDELSINQGKLKSVKKVFNDIFSEENIDYYYNDIGLKSKVIYTVKSKYSPQKVTEILYLYDELNRVEEITIKANDTHYNDLNLNKTINYVYDAHNRLSDERVSYYNDPGRKYATHFEYDSNGNIIVENEVNISSQDNIESINKYEYNEIDQLVSLSKSFESNSQSYQEKESFSYDNNGNLKYDFIDDKIFAKYRFDLTNHLSEYIKFSNERAVSQVNFDYFADGKRALKSNQDNNKVVFLYDYDNNLINDIQIDGSTLSFNFEGIIDDFHYKDNDKGLEYQLSVNQVQNIPLIIKLKENSPIDTSSFTVKSYGEIIDQNKSTIQVANSDQFLISDISEYPEIYSKSYYDTESDLEYMQARYYSPKIKRFISQDSFDLFNRYSYANSNPITYLDPGGHISVPVMDMLVGGAQMAVGAGLTASGFGYFLGNGMLISGTQLFVPGLVHYAQGDALTANAKIEAQWYGVTLLSSFVGLTGEIYGGRAIAKSLIKAGIKSSIAKKVAFIPNEWVAATLYNQTAYTDPSSFFSPKTYLQSSGNYFLTAGLYESLLKPLTLGGSAYSVFSGSYKRKGLIFDYAKNVEELNQSLLKNGLKNEPDLFGMFEVKSNIGSKNYSGLKRAVIQRDITKVSNSRIYYTSRSIYRALLPSFHESQNSEYIIGSSVGIALGLMVF